MAAQFYKFTKKKYWFVYLKWYILWLLLLFSRPVMSDSLQCHGLQHTRPPCPSPSPVPHSMVHTLYSNRLLPQAIQNMPCSVYGTEQALKSSQKKKNVEHLSVNLTILNWNCLLHAMYYSSSVDHRWISKQDPRYFWMHNLMAWDQWGNKWGKKKRCHIENETGYRK